MSVSARGNRGVVLEIPKKIRNQLAGQEYRLDRVGMSDSAVLLFTDKVLKIQKSCEESEREYCMMQWLQGKLPVPRILEYVQEGEDSFLLMSRCAGEMSCSPKYLENPDCFVRFLAGALKALWTVEIRDCPSDCTLHCKLKAARYNVEHGLVDMDNVEPDTFGEGGFEDPEHLLKWLYENQPAEDELVLSHGDFCLPNIFLEQGKVTGYIDLGRTGVADKWQDIALCYRSIQHNLEGKYSSGKRADGAQKNFDPAGLFDALGIVPDPAKLRYYILSDELF